MPTAPLVPTPSLTFSRLAWTPGAGIEILSEFTTSGLVVIYLVNKATGQVGLTLVPASTTARLVDHREARGNTPAWTVDSLVQVKCVGDSYPSQFCQGKTMRNSGSTSALRYVGQTVTRTEAQTTVTTTLENAGRYRCDHTLTWRIDEPVFECRTTFTNRGAKPETLEMLSSFSLGGLTPLASDNAPARLHVHRFRSAWSAEGRHECVPIEKLQLEGFHYPLVPTGERFGQVGSMPVRGWFPFVALEDREAGVTWGAQLATPGSWQLEIYRRDDMVSLSGGLADREFGHWIKVISPGESFTSPAAVLSVAAGGVDDVCAQMLAWQKRAPIVAEEKAMPVAFNEWCTTWGEPTQDKIAAMAERLKGSGVRYFVIDAGWSTDRDGWLPKTEAFPGGLRAVTQKIRDCGMIPGLWFEFEISAEPATSSPERQAHMLKRDGLPITTSPRGFWDFRDPWVHAYLSERVIDLLETSGFGYLKVDYNDTIGIGCDGAESLGEGLRQHLEGVQTFWRKIRTRLPDLVIETCASGGHRLEPSMLALADMASFSDAHEATDIPIVAANLHRLILPEKSQIWAVLRKTDSERRMIYSLTATLLGRMVLSGDIMDLDDRQWTLVKRAVAFYDRAKQVIRDGVSRRVGPEVLSYRHPHGWQAVLRHTAQEALVVCHGFAAPVPALLELELPEIPADRTWRIVEVLQSGPTPPQVRGNTLICHLNGEWSACTVILDHTNTAPRTST